MQLSDFPGCCTMKVISKFNEVPKNLASAKATSVPKKWGTKALAIALQGQDLYGAIIAFTGSHDQEGVFSPFAFAEYLREEHNQTVVETDWKLHPRHNHRVKGFYWTPSEAFLAQYRRSCERFKQGVYSTKGKKPTGIAAQPLAGRPTRGARA